MSETQNNTQQTNLFANDGMTLPIEEIRKYDADLANRLAKYDELKALNDQRKEEKALQRQQDAEALAKAEQEHQALLNDQEQQKNKWQTNLQDLEDRITNLKSGANEEILDEDDEDDYSHLTQEDWREHFKKSAIAEELEAQSEARKLLKKKQEEEEYRLAIYAAIAHENGVNKDVVNYIHDHEFFQESSYGVDKETGLPIVTHYFKSSKTEDKDKLVQIVDNGLGIFIANKPLGQPVTTEQAIALVMQAQARGNTEMRTTGSTQSRLVIQEVAEQMGLKISNKLDYSDSLLKKRKEQQETIQKSVREEMNAHFAAGTAYVLRDGKREIPEIKVETPENNTDPDNTEVDLNDEQAFTIDLDQLNDEVNVTYHLLGNELRENVMDANKEWLNRNFDIDNMDEEKKDHLVKTQWPQLMTNLQESEKQKAQDLFAEVQLLMSMRKEISSVTGQSEFKKNEFAKQMGEMGVTPDAVKQAREDRVLLHKKPEVKASFSNVAH